MQPQTNCADRDATGPDIRPADRHPMLSRQEFALRTALAIGLVAAALGLWLLRTVLLLAFAAMLVGVLLDGAAAYLARRTGWPRRVGLAVVTLVSAIVIIGGLFAFGAQALRQSSQLVDTLPSGWASLQQNVRGVPVAGQIVAGAGTLLTPERVAQIISSAVALLLDTIGGLLLSVAGGIYLAAQPSLYRRGALALVPRKRRARAAAILDRVAVALHHWLAGQIAVMAFVGILTGFGAWAIGLPYPLALGVIAGVLEFIPYAGPVLTVVPALLLAATVGPEALVLTFVLLVAVQQVEGYVLTPLVQRRATALPPLVTLFALFAAGTLLGILGALLAVPLAVALYAALGVAREGNTG